MIKKLKLFINRYNLYSPHQALSNITPLSIPSSF
jgi:hypothetical protein